MNLEKRILIMACIGGQITMSQRGFRQKDIRFYCELFTNWIDVLLQPEPPKWHNTQALRFLDQLCKKGFAKTKGAGKNKRYSLTRIGLLELTDQLINIRGYGAFQYTLLIYFFLRSYRSHILGHIQSDGSGFSKSVQIEIEHLFDAKRFLSSQIENLKNQIERLKVRVNEGRKASELTKELLNKQKNQDEIIYEISYFYPYELDAQKPMTELFEDIDPELKIWELKEGNMLRSKILWTSQLQALESYLKIFKAQLNEFKI